MDFQSYKMYLSAIVAHQKGQKNFEAVMDDFVAIFKAQPVSIRFLRGVRTYINRENKEQFDEIIQNTFEFY